MTAMTDLDIARSVTPRPIADVAAELAALEQDGLAFSRLTTLFLHLLVDVLELPGR